MNTDQNMNISSHHYYNQEWIETNLTWNNFDDNYNITSTDDLKFFGGAGEPTGKINWNVSDIIKIENNNSNDNVSIFLKAHNPFGTPSSDQQLFSSKEYLSGEH